MMENVDAIIMHCIEIFNTWDKKNFNVNVQL